MKKLTTRVEETAGTIIVRGVDLNGESKLDINGVATDVTTEMRYFDRLTPEDFASAVDPEAKTRIGQIGVLRRLHGRRFDLGECVTYVTIGGDPKVAARAAAEEAAAEEQARAEQARAEQAARGLADKERAEAEQAAKEAAEAEAKAETLRAELAEAEEKAAKEAAEAEAEEAEAEAAEAAVETNVNEEAAVEAIGNALDELPATGATGQ